MNRFERELRLVIFSLLAWLCAPTAKAQMPLYGNYYLHDPGTMIKDGTNYFIYGDGQGISGITSSDLRNWTAASPIFPGGPPAWTTNAVTNFTGYFWAPDVAYFNGRYNLYYACSQWGTINSAIGLVTSPSLGSPVWTDRGKVIESNYPSTTNTDLTAYNCIDPSIMVDTNGTVWMSFGSYSDGILIMQLSPLTGKRIATGSPIYRVANNGATFFSNTEEGSCLYQHGGYYYLFVNFGGCCAGIDSTYNIRVGRSTTVTGPFYDKNNVNMTNGGGTMVLESTARYIGPGHAAIMNDNGTYWFTYHYYDGNNNGVATVGLNRIYWTDDGWPALTNDWSAFYPLNTDAREHLALYNGTLQDSAVVTNEPGRGNVLSLNGISQYALLPVSVANAGSFAAWVKWNGGGGAWQRIFDFGNGTGRYLFLTPSNGINGRLRFAITTNSNGAEQIIDGPAALPAGSWCHVAVTLDGAKGLLYLDGIPVGTNSGMTLRPWQTLARSNYLGKSQWPDPTFNGKIDSFRIFGRALSGAEIRDLSYAHPALAHRYSFTGNAGDSIGMAHGTLRGNATVTNGALQLTGAAGDYINLPGGLVSGSSALTIEFWATLGANGNQARVFDFGNISGANGLKYLYFTPNTGGGTHRLEISSGSTANLEASGTLDGRAVFVACILDPTNGYSAFYTNGILEKAATNTLPALSSVNTNWSFIGRSLFNADAWLNASIDEFRIYDGRLTPEEIAADYKFGPDTLALPVTLVQSNAATGFTFSWPSWAAGFVLETTPALGTTWTAATPSPTLVNDRWWLAQSATNWQAFYRLRR